MWTMEFAEKLTLINFYYSLHGQKTTDHALEFLTVAKVKLLPCKKYVMISKKYNQNYLLVLFYYLPVVDFSLIFTPIVVGVCDCSMFCCKLLYVHSSIAIILMGKRELVALLKLSSWCLVRVEWLFLARCHEVV